MAIVEAWNATTDLFLCPLLFVIAVIDFLPNPARFLIRRLVSGQSSPPRRSMIREAGRKILIAVDETSHEAFDWALKSFLDPSKDYIYLLYIPQGDYRRATYRHRMIMNRGNYTSVLPGVDFLWEYCQKLDFANVTEFNRPVILFWYVDWVRMHRRAISSCKERTILDPVKIIRSTRRHDHDGRIKTDWTVQTPKCFKTMSNLL